ncbi:hypothetical protein AB0K25_19945 [Micromonospora sp. NPDC049257]|uniref:hypothetical protein n=1 Tax=Micromonospora sp. NPDC049257 TaxID=3155771 RepID=UPI00341BF271
MNAFPGGAPERSAAVTVVVAGGQGAGKTCFLRAAGHGHTTLAGLWEVSHVTLPGGVTVVLRAMPERRRWWWVWDQLAVDAVGMVVLVDTTCLPASYPVLDYVEARHLPFLVAINRPLGGARNRREIRGALRVDAQVPVLTCDATEPESVMAVLRHLITL